jgi:glycosyltransferase involved in cell wall biosynthesis
MTDKSRVTFATFFPTFDNSHLTKDVGMIPYVLSRDFGYESSVICYKNEEHLKIDTETPGIKVLYIKRKYTRLLQKIKELTIEYKLVSTTNHIELLCTVLEAIPVLLKTGKKIDILQLYHLKYESYIMGFIFKMINRNGILYLKLDWDPEVIKYYKKNSAYLRKKRHILYKKIFPFDIVSSETEQLYDFLRSDHPLLKDSKSLYYIPNGVDANNLSELTVNFDKKDNIILHVGRIGTYQKGSEIALEAFGGIARDFPEWRLVFIGTMEDVFTKYFNDFLERNKDIRDRISYIGYLGPKEEVYKYYARAKILVFPSRFESFGLVLVESGFFGNVILGSDIPSVREITNNGSYGFLCPVNDSKCFTNTLRFMISHPDQLKQKSNSMAQYMRDNYNWLTICGKLHRIFNSRN